MLFTYLAKHMFLILVSVAHCWAPTHDIMWVAKDFILKKMLQIKLS